MNSIVLVLFVLTFLAYGSKIITSENPQFPNQNGVGIPIAPGLLKKCGDGLIFFVSEQCDDGNLINGDGCSNCKVDKGWSCTKANNVKSVCINLCGNGIWDQDFGQQCQYTLPGRLCTLNCVRDQSKRETCMNETNLFLQPGQVCDGFSGCYNCLYINKFYECETIQSLQGKFISKCGVRCSPGSSTATYQTYKFVPDYYKIVEFANMRTSEQNIVMPTDKNQTSFWIANNINDEMFTKIQQQDGFSNTGLLVLMFYDTLINNAFIDQNGQLNINMYYPNQQNVFSYEIRYGTGDFNSYQNCFKMNAVLVNNPDATPIWPA